MKMTLTALVISLGLTALRATAAPSPAPTPSSTTAPDAALSAAEIKDRLEVRGEILVLDASGKKILYTSDRSNVWHPNIKTGAIESDWGDKDNRFGHVVLRHHWTPQDDGTIKVLIEEYATEETDPATRETKPKTLLQKKEFVLENFAPVVWKVQSIHDKNVVARLIPSLRQKPATIDVGKLPLANRDILVTDNQGYLWADSISFNETFVALVTHRGAVAFSLQPFAGATEVGYVEGNKVTLRFPGDLKISVVGGDFFLPTGVRAKIFGAYIPEKRSANVHSVHVYTSSNGEHFLDRLKS